MSMFFKREERRKFQRVPTHLLMKYAIEGHSGAPKLSFIRNISPGGVLFFAEEEIPPGTPISIIMNMSSPGGQPLQIKAVSRTIHMARIKGVNGYSVGAEFTDIDPADREFLIRKFQEKCP